MRGKRLLKAFAVTAVAASVVLVLPAPSYALDGRAVTDIGARPIPLPPGRVPMGPEVRITNTSCDTAATTTVQALGRRFDPRLTIAISYWVGYEIDWGTGFIGMRPATSPSRTEVRPAPNWGSFAGTFTAPPVPEQYRNGAVSVAQVVTVRGAQNNGTVVFKSSRCTFT